MLNDWKWEKIDDSECHLKDTYGHLIAYLIRNYNDHWYCKFYNNDFNICFAMDFEGIDSAELVQWQATLWIHTKCNDVANSFHRIRDHLPDLNEFENIV